MISLKSNPRRILTADEAPPVTKKTKVFTDAVPSLPVFAFHDYAKAFPLMEGEAFQELVDDIAKYGLREPIVLFEGKILDGRNRYRACHATGVPFRTIFFPAGVGLPLEADPRVYVYSKNGVRRHLTQGQRALAAAALFGASWKHGGDRQAATVAASTQKQVAHEAGISDRLIRYANVVQTRAEPEVKAAVVEGAIPLHRAAEISRKPAEEQRAAVAPKPPKPPRHKRKTAGDLDGPAAIRAFVALAELIAGREKQVAGLVRGHPGAIDVMLKLADELVILREQPLDDDDDSDIPASLRRSPIPPQ